MVDPSRPSTATALLVVAVTMTVVVSIAGPGAFGAPLAGEGSQGASNTATAVTPSGERAAVSPTETRTRAPRTAAPSKSGAARRYSYALREGANETAVYVYDSGRPGPSVVVVGGQHGNEPAGYLAAEDVADWEVDRGVLVVVPRANPRGVRNRTRKVDGRDLNAQFPAGERPTSAQARAVWRVVERHDADVVVDLHSSEGIYGVDGGVGQAVFPTVTGAAVKHAESAIARVNRRYGLDGNRSFRRGNVMGRSGQSLTRKVAGDLNETAYVVETTKQNTELRTRVRWTKAMIWELLRLHGLASGERRDDLRQRRVRDDPTTPETRVPTVRKETVA